MGLSDDLCHQGSYRNSTCWTGKVNLSDFCNRDEVPWHSIIFTRLSLQLCTVAKSLKFSANMRKRCAFRVRCFIFLWNVIPKILTRRHYFPAHLCSNSKFSTFVQFYSIRFLQTTFHFCCFFFIYKSHSSFTFPILQSKQNRMQWHAIQPFTVGSDPWNAPSSNDTSCCSFRWTPGNRWDRWSPRGAALGGFGTRTPRKTVDCISHTSCPGTRFRLKVKERTESRVAGDNERPMAMITSSLL